MTLAILTLAGTILGFVFKYWWAKRTENATPEAKYERAQEVTNHALLEHNDKAVSIALDDKLDRLRELQGAASRRGSEVHPKGPDSDSAAKQLSGS